MDATNFHQLHIFYTVAKLRSFSKAAEELSISQPAVSIQVRELENAVGTQLFHRMRKGLALTDTGQTMYNYSQRIFALAEEMHNAVQDIQGLRRGKLSIGSSTTPGEYILPAVIGQFRKEYPAIEVSLSITNTQNIIQRVLDREFDMGMAGAIVNAPGLNCFRYVDDEIVVIAAPSHRLASRKNVSLEDLQAEPFIMREFGSATRSSAENCLNSNLISVHTVMELGSNEAVKRAVAADLGLGIISRFGVLPDTAAGMITVLNVRGWHCLRPLTVFYRDDQHLPSAQQAFLDFLKAHCPAEAPMRA